MKIIATSLARLGRATTISAFPIWALATPAFAENEVAIILDLAEPVCRSVELPAAVRLQALQSLGWQATPENVSIDTLAAAQVATELANNQIDLDAQNEEFEFLKTVISKRLADDFDSGGLAARWFTNPANPNLGLMFASASMQGFKLSECQFVISAPDDQTLADITNLFSLSRARVTAVGTLFRSGDAVDTEGGQIVMSHQLVLLDEPSNAAVLSLSISQIGAP